MTDLVPRTVTEIGEGDSPVGRRVVSDDDFGWSDVLAGDDSTDWIKVLAEEGPGTGSKDSQTLEDFRECDAYVLLAPPGGGKTTLFEDEGKRDGCLCVSARDFLVFDIKDMSEWREVTLFIDGLDEKRAGSPDGLTPLDGIRRKIVALGRPPFRISCREADWFGSNDRAHLRTASCAGRVTVLRLNPLSDEGIRELLNRRADIDDADAFVHDTRERRIDQLLTNPQNLNMLADAVSGGAWPQTRLKTFELACEKLVQEFNPGHQLANPDRPATPELLAVTGKLCAIQLLTGYAGYDISGHGGDSEYLGLQSVPAADRATLRLALSTRLFKSPEERDDRRIPEHRQIAEFLGARYLATLIDGRLPVGRVLALMTGDDGGVVSELRGLSAWLAAHCLEARRELIERDPEGVAVYGDAGVFKPEEIRRLLDCLWPVDPSLDASLFTSLATANMVPVLLELLNDRSRDDEHRKLVLFLLCVLANATPLPELGNALLDLAERDDYPANTRIWAAICLAEGALEQPAQFGDFVRCLLSGLRKCRIRDEAKTMLGQLLQLLYPKFIGPDEVFDYLDEDHERNHYIGDSAGPYDVFWQHYLPMETRPGELVIVLEKLEETFERSEGWRRAEEPPPSPLVRAAHLLVQKALDRTEEHDPQRTLRWLKLTGGDTWGSSQSTIAIRGWIEAKPERYKDLFRESVTRAAQSGNFDEGKLSVKRPLHGASPPSDYGRWCLTQIGQGELDETLSKFWFEEAWYALLCGTGADGLTLEHLEYAAARNPSLAPVLDDLRSTDTNSPIAKMERDERQHNLERRQASDQRFAEWRQVFIRYEEALRENRCPAGRLNTIAEAYLGLYTDIGGDNGRERLREFLGEDALAEAAMDGLRGAILRDDLPTPKEVLALRGDNQRHLLAFPVVAGLELVSADNLSKLSDGQARLTIAMFVASRPPSRQPVWLRHLFESHPDMAAEEIVRFAAMGLRRGERHVSLIYEMLDHQWMSEVARIACPKLLRAFPVRAPRYLFDVLKRLLWWGTDNLEASAMGPIVATKLGANSMTAGQRAYWLAAQLVVSSEPNLAGVEAFAEKHANALSGLFAFYQRPPDQTSFLRRLPSPSLGRLARLLGANSRPLSAVRSEPGKVIGSELVRVMLEVLGTRGEDDALRALAALGDDPRMAAWHTIVQRVQKDQRVVRRDAGFRHPDPAAVCRTLECRHPANVADLAALTFDFISGISKNIRHGDTNDWRQYWNGAGKDPQSWTPRHEDHCRDAVLSDLQARLHPLGVNAAPEGRYADEKRADIRVSYGEFNVPIEIKKSSHRDLWSAIRNQLITKYARDPGAGGYGIYLAFWFGRSHCQSPESGPRPRNARELEERLRSTLTSEEARLISIRVIDVARP